MESINEIYVYENWNSLEPSIIGKIYVERMKENHEH